MSNPVIMTVPAYPLAFLLGLAMNDIINKWNEFAKMKCLSAPEEIIVSQEMNRLSNIGITKEAIIKGIENYREALSLPNSMANQHPLGFFLRKYLRESFIDGMYDPKRYSKNGYVKPKQEITTPTYVSPRPDHVLTLDERRAIKERMMKTDVKVNALLGAKDHIVDVNKKVANLQALGLTVKESLEVGTIKPDLKVDYKDIVKIQEFTTQDHISQVGKKESKWPEYIQAVRDLKKDKGF